MAHPCPIILILGPTAGGKTHLAIELAGRLPGGGECVSADSIQVYRGMDIGTAKSTADERKGIPHHLIDIIDPSDDGFTVDAWLERAEQTVAGIRSQGRWPIIVGGTNLYVQALLYGFVDGPKPDPKLRAMLEAIDTADLRRELERVDPAAAARIHYNDRKRAIRAIEVHSLTGRTLSEMQTQWEHGPIRSDVLIIGLDWPVELINRRINARVKHMIDGELVEEVQRIKERFGGGGFGRQAAEGLGYKQILEHLEGRCTLEEAIEQIKIRTRRYAKQQRTWLRRFRPPRVPNAVWLDAGTFSPEELVEEALRACEAAQPT